VRITSGSQHVATFAKTEMSQRKYCAKCGGHLVTNHFPAEFGGSGEVIAE
jgi:hypothetical protein